MCYGSSGLRGTVVILHKAVGIADIADLCRGKDIGRAVGARIAFVAYSIGRNLGYTSLDARTVDLYNEILRRGCQAATYAGQQKNPVFKHLCNN